MPSLPHIILRKGKEEPVKRFHPWIFSGAIQRVEGSAEDGDTVEVYSSDRSYLATGHYQKSSIAVKLLTWQKQEIDKTFWKAKLDAALKLRERLGLRNNPETNCYRLVHNEGDSMPGLIVDIYNHTAVLQAHSLGMYKASVHLAESLVELFNGEITSVYNKSSESLRKMTGLKTSDGLLMGEKTDTEVVENGCRFKVDIPGGQKTGFFLDQRDNRKLLGEYSHGKNVLNMFSYTGGFSVYALKAGANFVHSVDYSEPACVVAENNCLLNGFDVAQHKAMAMDARQYLENIDQVKYDLIILDPPAYAKNIESRKNAIKGYSSLNKAAIRKIAPGGIIFTFSCSQVVDRQQFTSAIMAAAIETGRRVQIIGQMGQPADHPVNIFQPEGEYLKGLILRVE